MTQFHCECGHTVDITVYPSPHSGFVIFDQAFNTGLDAAAEKLARQQSQHPTTGKPFVEDAHDAFSDKMTNDVRVFVVCPSCNSLSVQEQPRSRRYVRFTPTDGQGIPFNED